MARASVRDLMVATLSPHQRPSVKLCGALLQVPAEAEAHRLNTTGAIAVVDDGGSLLYLVRIDNTFPAGPAVATEKARTAATFRTPTRNLEDAVKRQGLL